MEVLVVGSCNTDLISYVPELPRPGETVSGTRFKTGCGGKGANQCVMAARLGVSTAMVAKVGNDQFGRDAIQNFRDNNVNVDHVTVTREAHSGVASITVNDRGENCIVIVSGANMTLSPADVQAAAHLIRGSKVVVCQLEVPPDTSLEALRLAKQNGVLTIFNTAPAVPLSDDFFHSTDILVLNETEAEVLTGIPVGDVETAKQAVNRLLARGPGCVVLTLGAGGVVFSGRGSEDTDTLTHIPAESVATVDTTGAGDAFVGAMAYYLSRQRELAFSEVVRRSGVIASHTTTLPGTQTSYQVNILPPGLT
ncbi:Ribokinase [Geodia barretti]|uniref:Ribokinase n=1 Tax=Geodia barretti TaxID=519541 RepID=A0AA35R6B7_GEOBA|nr:Ribokinase [Geodia barretti]